MKIRKIPIIAVLALSGLSAAAFVHPGTRSASKYELDFVKEKIKLGSQPWAGHLASAKNSGALGPALNWYLTGDEGSAKAAIASLSSWNGHGAYDPGPNQSSLEGAWVYTILAPAAEIMNQYPGWKDADKTATKNMFKQVFLNSALGMSTWNGNCDLTQIDGLLSMAVFLDDKTSFDAGIDRLRKRLPAYFYLSTDDPSVRNYGGSNSGSWFGPKWTDGVTQETCRDNNHHAQFAIAAALSALETAYLQGVDLYTPNQTRMVAAMELMGKQLATGDMQGVCGGAVTGDRYNTLEIGYNHYHNRKGVPMPNTWSAIQKSLRNGAQQFNMFHETLTNGDIDYTNSQPPAGIVSSMSRNSISPSISFRSNGGLEISSNGTQVSEITVLSLNGSLIQHSSVNMAPGSSQVISLGGQKSTGLYFVTVRSSNGIETFKSFK